MSRASLVGTAAVLIACSGGAKSRPAPPSSDPAGPPVAPAPAPAPPRPPVDPTVPPPDTFVTMSIDKPGDLVKSFGKYAATAGFPGASIALEQALSISGIAADQPLTAIVMRQASPQLVVAASVGDKERVEMFAQSSGWQARVVGGRFVMGAPDMLAVAGEHALWRLAQPVPPGARVEIAPEVMNQAIATVLAGMPAATPMPGGFDSLVRVSCEVAFTEREATVRFLLGARPGTGFAKFTQGLGRSEYKLAGVVGQPGAVVFVAGKLDLAALTTFTRSWLGSTMDAWADMLAVSDGEVAMRFAAAGGAFELVSAFGLRDTATAAAAYEGAIAKLKTPTATNFHYTMTGKPRVKKVAGQWVHELKSTPTAEATESERAMNKRLWGSDSTRTLVGVYGKTGLNVGGKQPEKTMAKYAALAKKPRKVADARVTAAIAESKRANESAFFLMDLAALVGMMAPGAMPGPPTTTATRMGFASDGGALAVRLSVPAEQIAAFRAVMPAIP